MYVCMYVKFIFRFLSHIKTLWKYMLRIRQLILPKWPIFIHFSASLASGVDSFVHIFLQWIFIFTFFMLLGYFLAFLPKSVLVVRGKWGLYFNVYIKDAPQAGHQICMKFVGKSWFWRPCHCGSPGVTDQCHWVAGTHVARLPVP